MEYRTLKGTDLNMSCVTFGTIRFAASEKRPNIDTEEGKRAMHMALDMGVNTIHTSYEYLTRPVVADVLKERKDAKDLNHIIKVPSPDGKLTDGTFSADYFRKLVEDALKEMNCERIDLLQWIVRDGKQKDPEASVAKWHEYKDDLKAIFEKLRDEGKVGYLGNFVYNEAYAKAVAQSGRLSALLFYYNLWDTTMQNALEQLDGCGMGAVVLRPFHGGMLVNKRADRHNLPEGDRFETEDMQERLANRDKLFEEVGLQPEDLTEFGIKFTLSQPNIASVITGLNTREQVKKVLNAVDGNYPDPSLAGKLRQAADKFGFAGN